jgi:D-aminopeptidase
MLRADDLTVVHHDDSVSHFTDVRYMLARRGLRVVLATGEELLFGEHEMLTTYARTAARTDGSSGYAYPAAA